MTCNDLLRLWQVPLLLESSAGGRVIFAVADLGGEATLGGNESASDSAVQLGPAARAWPCGITREDSARGAPAVVEVFMSESGGGNRADDSAESKECARHDERAVVVYRTDTLSTAAPVTS